MLRRIACVALALGAVSSSLTAAPVKVGTASINLPPPTGFCELSENNASDKRMLPTIGGLLSKGGNKLLSYSADCRQLADWHASKRQLLDDYAQYQTSIGQMEASSSPGESTAQTCATWRAEGEKILSNLEPDIKARVESTLKNVKMNENTFIGVLAEEPNACYAGIIQKLRTEANTDKTQLNLFAVTIVKNKSIFVYRFGAYANSDTVTDMLAKLKANVAALYAANR